MPDLSTEDVRRLARDFLVGRGGEAELEDAKRAMDAGPALSQELLKQMQAALEDVAPAGFSPDQWKEIDARVAALIQPLAKSSFGLGFLGSLFSRLFKRKAAPKTSGRIKRKGAFDEGAPKAPEVSVASPSTLASPSPGLDGSEGMEEMAPIAPAAAQVQAAAPAAEDRPAPAPRPRRSLGPVLAWSLLILLVGGLGAWGAWKLPPLWKARHKAVALAKVLPTALVTQAATPRTGPPSRQQPPASQSEPLPSELPPMTPQPAGQVRGIPGLEAKDAQGGPGLPLP